MGTVAGVVVFVVVLVFLLLAGLGCSRNGSVANRPPTADATNQATGDQPAVQSAEIQALDREHVRAMLKKIARASPPRELKMGAMCYKPAAPSTRAEYICPTCAERTLYEEGMAQTVEWEVPACRREFAELKKLTGDVAALDESQFCRKCSPEVKQAKLVLTFNYEGGQKNSVAGIRRMDLRLLHEFFSGKLVHRDEQDSESAMQQHLTRLEALLGVGRQ